MFEINTDKLEFPLFVISTPEFTTVADSRSVSVMHFIDFETGYKHPNFIYLLTEEGNAVYPVIEMDLIEENVSSDNPTEHYQKWDIKFMWGPICIAEVSGKVTR